MNVVDEEEAGGHWRATFVFPHAGDGIDLIAGPYRVEERRLASVDGRPLTVRTWFHPELADLAAGYLDSAVEYLRLYEGWIGPYPFGDFGIVSSPTPTGFGMPSLTYLGVQVLRLPFIRHTSLGHEVLHNWWGNGVYVDYAHGNWAEGLTTFMADYHYRARRGERAAGEQRLAWLRDFAAVPDADDRPLASFTARSHGASQVVGYHKAAMLFVMLRDRIGATAFDRGVRRFWREHRFDVAGWDELRAAFEAEAGRDLGDAFEPWLRRTGAPAPRVVTATATAQGARVELAQAEPPWPLRLPLRFDTAAGEVTRVVDLHSARRAASLSLPAPPDHVSVDPAFRLFRELAPGEAPPILRDLALAAEGGVVESLAARLFDHPARQVAPADAARETTLLVVGGEAAVTDWLAAHGLPPRPPEVRSAQASAAAWVLRDGARVVGAVAVREPGALEALLRPLPHYGRQSWLLFEGSRAVARGVWPAQTPRIPVAPP